MKVVAVLLVLSVVSVSVYSESCSAVKDCIVTGCTAGGNLVCDDDGKCTCETGHQCTDGENVGVNCHSGRQCRSWYDSSFDHKCECADTHSLHCIDGKCKCGFPSN
ncbi:uncharacterized protein LOC121389898 [Gigantopelta aegis]|uniref:uncharacterized protein LOC121389898 n=1 Tax=Gigantopelta aegis TaxID=1735272 RepID=UPI001B889F66|nr:uncharacterized protein LOC121389898 [Gigantopelta aegis]